MKEFMKSHSRLAVVLFVGGCASASTPPQAVPAPEVIQVQRSESDPFAQAMAALEGADYESAHEALVELSALCPANSEVGFQALLLSASTDLDPRNPDGRIDRAATSIASALSESHPGEEWTEFVAETLYLLALNIGATLPDSTGAANGGPAPVTLAEGSGNSMPPEASGTSASGGEGAEASEVVLHVVGERDPCGASAEKTAFAPRTLPELPLEPIALRILLLEQEKAVLTLKGEELSTEIERLEEEIKRIRRTLIP